MYTVEHNETEHKFNVTSPNGKVVDSYTYRTWIQDSKLRAERLAGARCAQFNK